MLERSGLSIEKIKINILTDEGEPEKTVVYELEMKTGNGPPNFLGMQLHPLECFHLIMKLLSVAKVVLHIDCLYTNEFI